MTSNYFWVDTGAGRVRNVGSASLVAMRFETTIELGGKTATGFEVPDEIVEALGAGKRPAVSVTVGGHTYRSTVAVMGGRYLVPLSAENRAAAGVAAGDNVEVEIEVDTAERVLDVPEDLAAAIAADAGAQAFWDSISYSRRRRIVLAVDGAEGRRNPTAPHREVGHRPARGQGLILDRMWSCRSPSTTRSSIPATPTSRRRSSAR